MKNKLRPYFSFSKKERTGILLLVGICLLLVILPGFFPEKELKLSDKTLLAGLQLLEESEKNNPVQTGAGLSVLQGELFPFNPNSIDAAGWVRLGLDEKIVKRILNYRNKGGRFYRAGDIKKIWGLPPDKAAQLIPFIVLPEQEKKSTQAKKEVAVIDINTADLKDWESMPGIGETLAGRIIKYRNHSGGFARKEEVKNVFGLTDSTFLLMVPYLRVTATSIPKLLLNRASAYQIIQKAGFPADLASEIVKKRQQEGNFSDWSELESLPGMNTILLEALKKAFQLE